MLGGVRKIHLYIDTQKPLISRGFLLLLELYITGGCYLEFLVALRCVLCQSSVNHVPHAVRHN
jgi:hypothetical protein